MITVNILEHIYGYPVGFGFPKVEENCASFPGVRLWRRHQVQDGISWFPKLQGLHDHRRCLDEWLNVVSECPMSPRGWESSPITHVHWQSWLKGSETKQVRPLPCTRPKEAKVFCRRRKPLLQGSQARRQEAKLRSVSPMGFCVGYLLWKQGARWGGGSEIFGGNEGEVSGILCTGMTVLHVSLQVACSVSGQFHMLYMVDFWRTMYKVHDGAFQSLNVPVESAVSQ